MNPRIHRITGTPDTVPVNAYLVEGEDAVVAVDGTLTVSGGRALRTRAQETGKPLAGVLVTHAHPDHYGGLVELVAGDDIPIRSVPGVAEVIRRDDVVKETILRPMLGDEWPRQRRFPDGTLRGGEPVELGGLRFTVLDLGPGESPHDSVLFLGDDRRTVFSADVAYDHMHGYLADGFHDEWRDSIARLQRELPPDAVLHPGHGEPAGPELLAWQADYIATFLDAVRGADWSEPERARAAVATAMTRFLADERLRFLMELSIEPVAAQLGLVEAART